MTPTMPGSGGGNASHTHPYSPGSLLVAASDAHITTRLSADYVCDGTADDVDLNAAIAAAGAGKVVLTEGTFTVADIITPVSNLILEGQGWSTIIKLATDHNDKAIYGVNTTDVTLRNFKLDGNKANQSAPVSEAIPIFMDSGDRCHIDRVWVADSIDQAIHIFGAHDSIVEKCRITSPTYDGIKVLASDDVQIVKNFLDDCGDDPIALTATGVDVNGGLIMGNVVRNSLTHGIKLNCVDGTAGSIYDVRIVHNRIYNATTYSIVLLVTTSTGAIIGTIVQGNNILDSGSNGIYTQADVRKLAILENMIRGGGANASGIQLCGITGAVVARNQIYDVGDFQCIGVGNSTYPSTGIRIEDNILDSPGTAKGIDVAAGATGTRIKDNQISGVATDIADVIGLGTVIELGDGDPDSLTYEFEDDFDKYQTWVEAETPWILNKGSAGGADPVIVADQTGIVRLVTGATAAMDVALDGSQLVGKNPLKVSQGQVVFEARLRIATAVTGVQICVGFTDVTTLEMPATISGTTITTNFSDGCVFVYDTTQTTDQWYCVGVAGNTDSTGNAISGVAPSAGVYQRLRIEIDNLNDARFYINGILVGTLTANACTAATSIYPTVVVTGDSTAKTVDVDRIYLKAKRKA